MSQPSQRAAPGAIVEPGQIPPAPEALLAAGLITAPERAEMRALARLYRAGHRDHPGVDHLTLGAARERGLVRPREGAHGRAPRAAGARRRGSRRTSSSSRSSGTDPGDPDDGDPPGDPTPPAEGTAAGRACRAVGCAVSLAGRAPQARYCSRRCSKRDERARREREQLAGVAPEGPEGAQEPTLSGAAASRAEAAEQDRQELIALMSTPAWRPTTRAMVVA